MLFAETVLVSASKNKCKREERRSRARKSGAERMGCLGSLRPFWTVLDHFGLFLIVCTNQTFLDRSGLFVAIMDNFGPCWTIWTILDHF